jgi:F420H(2)-dependent quinone reductase
MASNRTNDDQTAGSSATGAPAGASPPAANLGTAGPAVGAPVPAQATAANPVAQGRRQARIMRIVNVPMRAVLSLPFPTPLSANLMLVAYTGVKSGKAYLQPVSYARDGDTLLTPGGGRWTLNLKGGREVHLRLRGRKMPARADLIGDAAEVERLLGVIAVENPRAMRFLPIPRRADGRLDPDVLDTALRHGFRIVRWHLGGRP